MPMLFRGWFGLMGAAMDKCLAGTCNRNLVARIVGILIVGVFIIAQVGISPAQAQKGFTGKIDDEWLEPVNKAQPKGAQKLRVPTCPNGKAVPKECMDIFEQLKKLLQAYYIREYDEADAIVKKLANKKLSGDELTKKE